MEYPVFQKIVLAWRTLLVVGHSPFFLLDILCLDWTAVLMNPHIPFAGYTLLNWILFVFFVILIGFPASGHGASFA